MTLPAHLAMTFYLEDTIGCILTSLSKIQLTISQIQKRYLIKFYTNTRLEFFANSKVKFLNLIKDIKQKLTTNILANGELLQATLLKSKIRKNGDYHHLYLRILSGGQHWKIKEKRNGKQGGKVILHRWCVYIKNSLKNY